jgi:hypothetical protein
MEIKEFVKSQGSFLTADEVLKNPTAIFIPKSEGELITNKFGNERLHIQGEYAGNTFTFDLSKTNARELSEKLGSDTKKWIGKKIYLETYKTRTTEGKLTEAITIKKVE